MSVRRAVALALSAALGLTGLSAVTAPGAVAASTSPYEVTIPAPPSVTPPQQQLFGAGSGVQTADPATGRLRWQSLADGRVELRDFCDSSDRLAYFGDRVGCFGYHGDAAEATVYDFATGSLLTRARPEGHTWLRAFGTNRLLSYRTDSEGGAVTLSLLGLGEGAADTDITTGEAITGRPEVLAFDGAGAVVRYTRADQGSAIGLVDFAAATLKPLASVPAFPGTPKAALSAERIALYGDYATDQAHVVLRADPSAPGKTVALPGGTYGAGRIALLGEWIVGHVGDPYAPRVLKAVNVTTGAARDLGVLAATAEDLRRAPDGTLYVVGGTDSTHWGVRRVTLDAATGTPVTAQVLSTPPKPVQRTGLTLAAGRLTTEHTDAPKRELVRYDVSLTEPRTATRRWSCDAISGTAANCPPTTTTRLVSSTRWLDTGDGRLVTLLTEDVPPSRTEPFCGDCVIKLQVTTTGVGGTTRTVKLDTTRRLRPSLLIGASGRYVHFLASENYETRSVVADIETGKTFVSNNTNQALWGTRLWTATTANDSVSAVDLRTGAQVATADFGTDCGVFGLDVVGPWMYGLCGDHRSAVVYNRETKKTVRFPFAPTSRAVLGDGFLTYTSYAPGGDRMDVTDVRSGAPVTRTLGTPMPGLPNYNQGWTVDRLGGAVAFVDPQQAIRVVGLGGATSRATVTDSSVATAVNVKSAVWKPRWWVSKPVQWTLVLKNKATGKTVRTLTGEGRGIVAPAWDGKDAAGKYVANGAHVWSLIAKPADGQGADLTASGALAVSGAAAVRRDMAGDDGFGDLLVMDTYGAMSLYRGTGTGGVSARIAGVGNKFATTSLFVPVGDLNGDRCADVYARVGDQLRAYRPGCGKVLTASSPYTLVGSGWGGYDVLTSPGDVNGDGYADLVVRQASTGDVYFYGGTATHSLKARVRIGTNWKLYRKLVGAGDLNGDGRGDLLGVDSAGVLWRYYGTSTGGVSARVKVGGGWGGYSALVGVGDLSGDGKADLLARDTAGKLWRYASTGAGTYGTRVLIGSSGWNGFKGLF
ncbi:FG-GAP repeat domain-containing protein [Streptomyces sp. NRRL F-5727]|uniref:FG-GAP repeat domain-containing protein n=1 Tax=Streptomyces sp. NRRL F-5727 TaxID=1463871 RepID=UPI000AD65A94|nr:VCBS repeat-containing protein [Streptomyces sp. NRRL F-5727]